MGQIDTPRTGKDIWLHKNNMIFPLYSVSNTIVLMQADNQERKN